MVLGRLNLFLKSKKLWGIFFDNKHILNNIRGLQQPSYIKVL
jgi:hypothetical protein